MTIPENSILLQTVQMLPKYMQIADQPGNRKGIVNDVVQTYITHIRSSSDPVYEYEFSFNDKEIHKIQGKGLYSIFLTKDGVSIVKEKD